MNNTIGSNACHKALRYIDEKYDKRMRAEILAKVSVWHLKRFVNNLEKSVSNLNL